MAFPEVSSVVLNIQSVSDRLIALTCASTYIINLFDTFYVLDFGIKEAFPLKWRLKVEQSWDPMGSLLRPESRIYRSIN